MPIYEYQAEEGAASCPSCAQPFDCVQRMSEAPLKACPVCGAPVRKLISAPAVGRSGSGLDSRAKNAGFKKFKRLGKGEYEKQY